jgi:hypothetical protein
MQQRLAFLPQTAPLGSIMYNSRDKQQQTAQQSYAV